MQKIEWSWRYNHQNHLKSQYLLWRLIDFVVNVFSSLNAAFFLIFHFPNSLIYYWSLYSNLLQVHILTSWTQSVFRCKMTEFDALPMCMNDMQNQLFWSYVFVMCTNLCLYDMSVWEASDHASLDPNTNSYISIFLNAQSNYAFVSSAEKNLQNYVNIQLSWKSPETKTSNHRTRREKNHSQTCYPIFSSPAEYNELRGTPSFPHSLLPLFSHVYFISTLK